MSLYCSWSSPSGQHSVLFVGSIFNQVTGQRRDFSLTWSPVFVVHFILRSHAVNWCHILYVLSCDFFNKWMGQTGKVRTFRDKARLSAGLHYCAGLGKQLILSCILGIALKKGLMSLNGKPKRQRNFTWAVETLPCMEDTTELMDQPDPKEVNIVLTPCEIICLQSDP